MSSTVVCPLCYGGCVWTNEWSAEFQHVFKTYLTICNWNVSNTPQCVCVCVLCNFKNCLCVRTGQVFLESVCKWGVKCFGNFRIGLFTCVCVCASLLTHIFDLICLLLHETLCNPGLHQDLTFKTECELNMMSSSLTRHDILLLLPDSESHNEKLHVLWKYHLQSPRELSPNLEVPSSSFLSYFSSLFWLSELQLFSYKLSFQLHRPAILNRKASDKYSN